MTVHDPNSELHEILTGPRPHRGTPAALIVVPVLLLGLVAGGLWIRREALRPPAPLVDTSTCERLLTTASAASPDRFLVCASAPRVVYKLEAGRREPLSLAANTVYQLPIDGRTRIEGLAAPDLRYGYGGTSCERLTGHPGDKPVLLDAVPVDKQSC